jgi:hypothetical protein
MNNKKRKVMSMCLEDLDNENIDDIDIILSDIDIDILYIILILI